MVDNEENKTNEKIGTNSKEIIWTTLYLRKGIARTQNYMQAAKKSGADDKHVQQLHLTLLAALEALDKRAWYMILSFIHRNQYNIRMWDPGTGI